MSDGNVTPLALDGMAAFPHPYDRKLVRLIRNHEDRNPAGAGSNPVTPAEAATVYDPAAGGGTSTLDFDPRRGRLVQDFISLKGTTVNCAGGYAYGYRGHRGHEPGELFGFYVVVDGDHDGSVLGIECDAAPRRASATTSAVIQIRWPGSRRPRATATS
jgi:hypothetical protein